MPADLALQINSVAPLFAGRGHLVRNFEQGQGPRSVFQAREPFKARIAIARRLGGPDHSDLCDDI